MVAHLLGFKASAVVMDMTGNTRWDGKASDDQRIMIALAGGIAEELYYDPNASPEQCYNTLVKRMSASDWETSNREYKQVWRAFQQCYRLIKSNYWLLTHIANELEKNNYWNNREGAIL